MEFDEDDNKRWQKFLDNLPINITWRLESGGGDRFARWALEEKAARDRALKIARGRFYRGLGALRAAERSPGVPR